MIDLLAVDSFPALRTIANELAPDGYTARIAPGFSVERHGALTGWQVLLTRDADGLGCVNVLAPYGDAMSAVPEGVVRDLVAKAIDAARRSMEATEVRAP